MNSIQHILRDRFGRSALLDSTGFGPDLGRSWFFVPKRFAKNGEVGGVAHGHHMSLHLDLSLADVWNSLGTGQSGNCYKLVLRAQSVLLDKDGVNKFMTIVGVTTLDNVISGKKSEQIKEFPLVTNLSVTDAEALVHGIGANTKIQDIILAARKLGVDTEYSEGMLHDLNTAFADVTQFVHSKTPELNQGAWKRIYSANDFK